MIIGICGNNGAGKNTVGQAVEDYWDGEDVEFRQVAFADSLYDDVCCVIFDTPYKRDCEKYRQLKEMRDERWGNKTVREVLIATGEFCRSIKPDYWVWRLRNKLRSNINYIITDVRYKNEADICDVIIQVTRPGFTENTGDLNLDTWELDEENESPVFYISNMSDIASLRKDVFEVMKCIMSDELFLGKVNIDDN